MNVDSLEIDYSNITFRKKVNIYHSEYLFYGYPNSEFSSLYKIKKINDSTLNFKLKRIKIIGGPKSVPGVGRARAYHNVIQDGDYKINSLNSDTIELERVEGRRIFKLNRNSLIHLSEK